MEELNKSNGGVTKGPQQMSASLKERLKRCGRYYSSPTTMKNPNLDTGFSPTPKSASPLSLNPKYSTPTINIPVPETPPYANLTPSSFEDQRDSGFDDSMSLSCTPVLKPRDTQSSQPRAKKLRLSSRARFNVDPPPKEVLTDVTQKETNGNHPKEEICTNSSSPHLLDEERVNGVISSCGDGQHENLKSHEKNQLSTVSGKCSLLGDNDSQLADSVMQSAENGTQLGVSDQNGESQTTESKDVVLENLSCEELVARKSQLQKQLKEKSECLRKLRMVKLYRSKNDFSNLDELIKKWREVSQQVVVDLRQKLPEPKPTLPGLLQHLNIDQKYLSYNPEEETFY